MKAEFGRRRGEDGRSLVLKQSQIRSYFSRRAASMKRVAVDAVLRGDDDGDDLNAAAAAAADDDDDDDDDEYDGFKVQELKVMLQGRGLSATGRKSELISRLRADAEADPDPEETAPKRPRRK